MDCSLSTWPSITQFDDLTWMSLGDIDPLESLDRNLGNDVQLAGTSSANLDETEAVCLQANPPSDDTTSRILHSKSDDFYRLASAESLAAARWESINAVDLASVLDSFPRDDDTSTPSEDVTYDMYSDSIILQEEPAFAGEVDTFMSASMSELTDAKDAILHLDDKNSLHDDTNVMSSDYTSLSGAQDDVRCETSVVNDEPPGSINATTMFCGSRCQAGIENAACSQLDCKEQTVRYVSDGRGGFRVDLLQPLHGFSSPPVNLHGCPNTLNSTQGALDMKESISPQQQGCIQPCMMMHWSKPAPTPATAVQLFSREQAAAQLYGREQVGQQSPMCMGDNYPAIIDQHVRMADAARVSSELKRNRAQASRARRLAASQRRAKKYPLEKLIRMSSSSACVREKLDLGPSTIPHGSHQMVSQNLVKPLVPNSHLPTLQGTGSHVSSSHEAVSRANALQDNLKYQYRHLVTGLQGDNHMSPFGSSTLQTQPNGGNVHSLNNPLTYGATNIPDLSHSPDAVLLTQLQSIIRKMNVDTRLWIRDALYRLARSAKHRQSRTENHSALDENERQLQAIETNTNSIDRWIVNMLFCKQPSHFEETSHPAFAQVPTCQSMDDTNGSSSAQQWNSCGSSANLQNQPIDVLTGS